MTSIPELLEKLDAQNPRYGQIEIDKTTEWGPISAALRAAVAWLEAEEAMDVETVEENFHRDDLFDKADAAREAFSASLGPGEKEP